ncbi:MAG: hypothetical protein HQM16_10040 [Deltaproteobacteria bacterium]|nr:hypothetical protein [Deltaproteobacteria bacterium]
MINFKNGLCTFNVSEMPEGLMTVILVVFVFFTTTFIYNETTQPRYRGTSIIQINTDDTALPRRYIKDDRNMLQARLGRLSEHMLSKDTLEELAKDQTLHAIVQREIYRQTPVPFWRSLFSNANEALSHPQGPQEINSYLYKRIQTSLNINVDPDANNMVISVTDRNPQFVAAVADLLPKVADNGHAANDGLHKKIREINLEIAQSVDNIKVADNKLDTTSLDTETSLLKDKIKALTQRQALVLNKISAVIDFTSKKGAAPLPEPLKKTEIAQTHKDLIEKEIALMALKKKSLDPAEMNGALFLAQAKFATLLETTKLSLEKELKDLQDAEQKLTALLDKENQKTKNKIVADESQAEIFQKILKQKTLDRFYANETISVKQAALLPLAPCSPHKTRNILSAILGGLVVGVVIVIVQKWVMSRQRGMFVFK